MTGLVRKATLFSACGLLLAGAAMAAVPSPANSTIPANIKVVGTNAQPIGSLGVIGPNGTSVDPAGAFTVIVRDLANQPIPNSSVVIDVSGASDIFLCQDAFPGQIVDCVTNTVRGITDVTGSVTISVVGAANNTGPVGGIAAPGSGLDAVTIFADGVSLGQVHVTSVLDQNGASGGNGHNAQDLAFFSGDLGSAALFGTYRARSDYNSDEANSGLDLSVYSNLLGASALGIGSGLGCFSGSYCP
jgi:hypothetical protein